MVLVENPWRFLVDLVVSSIRAIYFRMKTPIPALPVTAIGNQGKPSCQHRCEVNIPGYLLQWQLKALYLENPVFVPLFYFFPPDKVPERLHMFQSQVLTTLFPPSKVLASHQKPGSTGHGKPSPPKPPLGRSRGGFFPRPGGRGRDVREVPRPCLKALVGLPSHTLMLI